MLTASWGEPEYIISRPLLITMYELGMMSKRPSGFGGMERWNGMEWWNA